MGEGLKRAVAATRATRKPDPSGTQKHGCDFVERGGVIFCIWADGREERIGKGYQEIAAWWRSLLARSLNTTVGSPSYNQFIDRAFGED